MLTGPSAAPGSGGGVGQEWLQDQIGVLGGDRSQSPLVGEQCQPGTVADPGENIDAVPALQRLLAGPVGAAGQLVGQVVDGGRDLELGGQPGEGDVGPTAASTGACSTRWSACSTWTTPSASSWPMPRRAGTLTGPHLNPGKRRREQG